MRTIHIMTEHDVRYLRTALEEAERTGRDVRVAWDGGLKVKVGGGMWSPPLTQEEVSA